MLNQVYAEYNRQELILSAVNMTNDEFSNEYPSQTADSPSIILRHSRSPFLSSH